jgi:hypothetical protein
MSLATLGGWMLLLFVVGGLFGTRLGGTNHFINLALSTLFAIFLLAPLVRWLLDGVLARRFPRLRTLTAYRWLVLAVGFVESLLLPPRPLGLPKLTLQSHLAPRLFLPVFIATIWGVAGLSNQWFQSGRGFDVFESQVFASTESVAGGHRSRHYESQRIARDRARPVPTIPSPLIETAYLPVFLPYAALIDDPVLRQRCPSPASQAATPGDGSESAEDYGSDRFSAVDSTRDADSRDQQVDALADQAAACLARLWELRLDGKVQSMRGFVISERGDLGLRGLTGYLPLNGLAAGPHLLEAFWRAAPEQDRIAEDYVPKRVRHSIPFVWSPEVAAQPATP